MNYEIIHVNNDFENKKKIDTLNKTPSSEDEKSNNYKLNN